MHGGKVCMDTLLNSSILTKDGHKGSSQFLKHLKLAALKNSSLRMSSRQARWRTNLRKASVASALKILKIWAWLHWAHFEKETADGTWSRKAPCKGTSSGTSEMLTDAKWALMYSNVIHLSPMEPLVTMVRQFVKLRLVRFWKVCDKVHAEQKKVTFGTAKHVQPHTLDRA